MQPVYSRARLSPAIGSLCACLPDSVTEGRRTRKRPSALGERPRTLGETAILRLQGFRGLSELTTARPQPVGCGLRGRCAAVSALPAGRVCGRRPRVWRSPSCLARPPPVAAPSSNPASLDGVANVRFPIDVRELTFIVGSTGVNDMEAPSRFDRGPACGLAAGCTCSASADTSSPCQAAPRPTHGTLRGARAAYRARQDEPAPEADQGEEPAVVLTTWTYLGSDYLNPATCSWRPASRPRYGPPGRPC